LPAIAGRAAMPIKPAASKALTSGSLLLSGNRLPAPFPRRMVKPPYERRSAIPKAGGSSQFEVCAFPDHLQNKNDSCLYYYLFKKSSDTFASPGCLGTLNSLAGIAALPA
jgi:hypothetical protein